MNQIEILFLVAEGGTHSHLFDTEGEAAEYLKRTHATEAPISFTYTDGTALRRPALERIHSTVFEGLSQGMIDAGREYELENAHGCPNDDPRVIAARPRTAALAKGPLPAVNRV